MRTRLFLSILFLSVITFFSASARTKVLFFGDSITSGATKTNGFITLLNNRLEALGMEKDYDLVCAGVSGNHVYDLYFRIEEDVLDKHPDIVVIFIGINDIWHKASFCGTSITQYEKYYKAILDKLKQRQIEVILCTPTVIGERKGNINQYDGDLNAYAEVVRRLSVDYQCQLIDLRKAFLDYLETNNTENAHHNVLTYDGVHFNDVGNMLASDLFFSAIFTQNSNK